MQVSTHTKEDEGRLPFADEGSVWFRRLIKEITAKSKYFKVRRIRQGFFRIYWKDAYVYEVYKEMPYRGYEWYGEDEDADSLKLMLEYEQDGDIQRKVKNFVEGYAEAKRAIDLCIYQFKNDPEHYKVAKQAYRQSVIK